VAQRIEHTIISRVAYTTQPGQTSVLTWAEGIVTGFRIRIPDGHNGKTGLQIWYAGQQIIPFTKGRYFRGNQREEAWDTEDFPTGPGWIANAYNEDIHAHKWYLTTLIEEIGAVLEEALPSLVLLPPAGGTLVV